MSKTQKRGGRRVSVPSGVDLNDLEFFRALAHTTNPGIDPQETNELAVIMQKVAKQFADHWTKFSKICNKNDDKMNSIGIKVELDRRTEPGEISVTSSYSEKYGSRIKARVPDPKVMELPFDGSGDTPAETTEGAGNQAGETQEDLTAGKE